ncbi:hypothetical protein CC78DRAFT_570030 [Lojkania enalia]|uniref:F-box domain-containing protein n=1 Tax=Lojkania enalia TaxID=147567 RepID=A0A9P4K9R7_9PLEO|nr:hypothetical protein CC78DRAFT_570030 [Didymosphaeria enalia]
MDLPNELILGIISVFRIIRSYETQSEGFRDKEHEKSRQCENRLRQRTLYSLSLTSRRFHRISQPILYSDFTSTAVWRGLRPLLRFRESIINQPYLASHVQYIENRLSDYMGNVLFDDLKLDGAVEMVENYFASLGDVIGRCPNITHLSVVSLEAADVTLWQRLVDQDSSPPRFLKHGFSKLRTLCVQLHSGYYSFQDKGVCFQKICGAMVTAPSLRNLRASTVVSCCGPDPMPMEFKVLESIDISECRLGFQDLVSLLEACSNLKHFGCQWSYLDDQTSQAADVATFLSALVGQKDKLESIRLDTRHVRLYPNYFISNAPLRFQGFGALRSLEICEVSLLGTSIPFFNYFREELPIRISELLPASLVSLTILLNEQVELPSYFKPDNYFPLLDLVEDCPRHLPNLKILQICPSDEPVRLEMARQQLEPKFARVGIEMSICLEPMKTNSY